MKTIIFIWSRDFLSPFGPDLATPSLTVAAWPGLFERADRFLKPLVPRLPVKDGVAMAPGWLFL